MMAIDRAATEAPAHPIVPITLEEAGLSADLVTQLLIKILHFSGELTGTNIADRLGLSFSAVEPVIEFLLREHQIEIAGGGLVGRPSYRYQITDRGRTRAMLFLENNQYVGTAPVPLSQYARYMNEFRKFARGHATRQSIRNAFKHLVISDRVLDQLGPAINDGHSMFVYGPPGNGKTVISQAIRNLLEGEIAIPHALEVQGNIVRLFDPVNHEPLPAEPNGGLKVEKRPDPRWIRCRRPMVMVGGELTLGALDLNYTAGMGFYTAPVQVVANGGVLVIDDFGRQHCSPRDLLNRWIVPLESRVDFLTLQSGQKFELPFLTLVVFATNIKPAELVDEAFLRRIQYKIFAESPTVEQFIEIFANHCAQVGIGFDSAVVEHLLQNYYRPRKIQLRGCQPRDLINQALSMCEYLGVAQRLTPALLEAACDAYFVDDRELPVTYA